MLFWACLLILLGLFGMGIAGMLLVMRVSESLSDLDQESWR